MLAARHAGLALQMHRLSHGKAGLLAKVQLEREHPQANSGCDPRYHALPVAARRLRRSEFVRQREWWKADCVLAS